MDAYHAFFIFTTGAAVVALGMREVQWRQRLFDEVRSATADWTADFMRRLRWPSNEAASRAMKDE